ncbi:HK97 family phage prohead protease [Alphaproteobacteria bacterium endosymbiont of Tiliacea citrago]|uniref:HK97 family phage prohead protease n=1 Tax=Alphaproteobacteria bacterium endosymbiont of Tiliacea citrago TaxID=3077944 RepID=UPI00313F0478
MITKFSDNQSLVNNDFIAKNFSNDQFSKLFLFCKIDSFSCKKVGEVDVLRIQGLATSYNNSDLTNDVISKDAFASNADSDGFLKKMPAMFFEHDSRQVPGKWTSVKLTKIGIEVEGEISDSKVIDLVQQDNLNGLSIGFFIVYSEMRYNLAKNKNYRYIKQAKLVEISLVANPANSKAFFSPVNQVYFGDSNCFGSSTDDSPIYG